MDNYMTISEIKNVNDAETVMIKGIVNKVEELKTSKGSTMYGVQIEDKTGKLEFKIWDNLAIYARMAEDCIGNCPCEFSIFVKPTDKGIFYNADFARPLDDEKIEDYSNDFTPSDDILNEKMNKYLSILKANREDLYNICNSLLAGEKGDDFVNFPAGISMHHANPGGLMYHTVSMLEIAESMMEVTDKFTPIKYNREIVYAAIILHDFFKVEEYKVENNQTKMSRMSILSHYLMSCEYVYGCFKDGLIDLETRIELEHVIASHHGELEFGAIVTPATREALLVHYVDSFNAKDNAMVAEMITLEPGELAKQKNYCLNSTVYRPKNS